MMFENLLRTADIGIYYDLVYGYVNRFAQVWALKLKRGRGYG